MNESVKRGMNFLHPGTVVPIDVKTVADLHAALRYTVEQLKALRDEMEELRDEDDDPEFRDCPVCRQDVLMLTGNGLNWKCGTCGHYERVERQEP